MSSAKKDTNGRRNGGVSVKKHLDGIRVADLRDVFAFWAGTDAPAGTKKELVAAVSHLMGEEGTVYRRVRTLTRKVLDVLLLLLRRDGYASDLPGLFQRLPGEDAVDLEFHEAEAGLKALTRRGFLAQMPDKGRNGENGRVRYAVPEELGSLLTSLFREETRTVASVFSFRQHAATITAKEREQLRVGFPELAPTPGDEDVQAVLGEGGTPALLSRLDEPLGELVTWVMERHGGVCTRAGWSARNTLKDVRWDRDGWASAFEAAAVGTVARLSLTPYGIASDDELLVIFEEVLADLIARTSEEAPEYEELLRGGPDLIADLDGFLESIRRTPVKTSRSGDVYKAGKRKIQRRFVFRESFLVGPDQVWDEVYNACVHHDFIGPDADGFLEVRPDAEAWLERPLEDQVLELYQLALEQAGPRGRSLHQHELRNVVADLLREFPQRWWPGRSLAMLARHRYLGSLDERGIKDRHRDRFFSAYFSGRETPEDLLDELHDYWMVRLYVLGLLDVAVQEEQLVALRLSPLGARVLGAELAEVETGLRPLLVNPDFEVLVLPEGDVSDVVHTLDGYAERTKTGDVVHFRLTKEAIEAAVGRGRSVDELIAFLEGRARGDVPQNVLYSLSSWAGWVTFATLERGFVLRANDEAALDRILAFPEMEALVVRRIGSSEALLKSAPADKKLLAALRERGIELQGP